MNHLYNCRIMCTFTKEKKYFSTSDLQSYFSRTERYERGHWNSCFLFKLPAWLDVMQHYIIRDTCPCTVSQLQHRKVRRWQYLPPRRNVISPSSPAIYFYSLMLDDHFVVVAKQCSTERCERLYLLIKLQDARHTEREEEFSTVCVCGALMVFASSRNYAA